MSTDLAPKKQKINLFFVHIVIAFLWMFGFGFLTPIGSITPIGMKLLGIFIGLVYAWSTTSLIWPSLLGIVAVAATGLFTMPEFLKLSFGNDNVLFLFFTMIFAATVDELGLVTFIANWFTSRKVAFGRPWLFSFFFLMGAFIGGCFVSGTATVIIFWSIFYAIARQVGLKPYSKYCNAMILGVVLASMTFGASILPYRLAGLLLISTIQAASGVTISFSQYLCFSIPTSIFLMISYILICKYVLKPDVSALLNINDDFVDKSALIMNKKQKTGLLFLTALVLLLLLPDFIPQEWAFTQFLKHIGTSGVVILLLVLMFFVKFDNQSMMNFKKMVYIGVSWDIVVLFAIVLPLSGLLTSDATGIKPFLIDSLSPILSQLSPSLFILCTVLLLTLLTNVANNAVLMVIFINLLCPLALAMDMNPVPIAASMLWFSQLAYMTPGASAPAAVLFGNSEWIHAKDMYRNAAVIIAVFFILILAIILPFAQLIF